MSKKTINNLDYTTKDYEGFRNLMMSLIPTKTPEWTDTSESDMGVVILELLAYGLDILSHYQDKAFNEAFLPTASNRRSILDLCKNLGYTLKGQKPSKYKLKVVKSSEYQDDKIVVSKGTKVTTDPSAGDTVVFELDSDLTIPGGELEGYVNITQGETVQKDILGPGTGLANQKLQLSYADALKDTITVYLTLRNQQPGSGKNASDKIYWEQVDDFLTSTPEDKHYMVEIDEFNNTYIVFGNGISGATVPKEYTVNASYRYGGGDIGNVGLNTINTIPHADIPGIAMITNPELPIQYGHDAESIEHARDSAPRYFRMQNRLITKQDFEDFCVTKDGIALAEVVETFNEKGEVLIYLVPSDYGDSVPEKLKEEILREMNLIKLLKDIPILKDPTYLDFDITVNIVAYPNYTNAMIQEGVEQELKSAFGIANMTFNEEVLIASIFRTCMGVAGVKNVQVENPTEDILPYDSSTKTPRVARLRNLTVKVTGGVNELGIDDEVKLHG